jgi:phosphotransferase system IIB component
MNSILNIDCSMFTTAKATEPEVVNLLYWLHSDKYLLQQLRVRSCMSEDEQKAEKLLMPCITPSGLFSKRGKNYLQKHTGLIAIDIDLKDNLHLSNFAKLKSELCKIQNVAYCGLSVSGKGYWMLIPITYPDQHEEHFKFIESYFKSKSLVIDSACKDIARLRFYSYDTEAYFNHAAIPLQAIYSQVINKQSNSKQIVFNSKDKPVWDQYNETKDFQNVLLKHGWQINNEKGCKTYFTRPGKRFGISAEFDDDKNIFYVFSSSTEFESSKGYNPFQVYAILDHGRDFSQAAKTLMTTFYIK